MFSTDQYYLQLVTAVHIYTLNLEINTKNTLDIFILVINMIK